MLLTFKALLISGALLAHDKNLFHSGDVGIKKQNTLNSMQDKEYKKAVNLTLLSSYVDLIEHDNERAMNLLQEACNLDYGRACWYYTFNTNDKNDALRAKEVLTKSCFAGEAEKNGESCTFLGIMASHNIVEVDYDERELYERACNLNDGWGCYRLASDFIADVDEDMEQANKVAKKALDILVKSCGDGNAFGCYFAGDIYHNSILSDLLEDSYDKSKYYYIQGCNLGNGDSCLEVNEK